MASSSQILADLAKAVESVRPSAPVPYAVGIRPKVKSKFSTQEIAMGVISPGIRIQVIANLPDDCRVYYEKEAFLEDVKLWDSDFTGAQF